MTPLPNNLKRINLKINNNYNNNNNSDRPIILATVIIIIIETIITTLQIVVVIRSVLLPKCPQKDRRNNSIYVLAKRAAQILIVTIFN
jgi:hypothetical protein